MNSTHDPRKQQNRFNTHQTDSLICLWVLFSVSSVVMILRLISQFGILRIIRVDDVLMIIAWVRTSPLLAQYFLLIILVYMADLSSSKNNHIHNRHPLGPRPARLATSQQTGLWERNEIRNVLHDLRHSMRDIRSSVICRLLAILHSTSFPVPNISGLGHHCAAAGD